jgi:hypothetical protein
MTIGQWSARAPRFVLDSSERSLVRYAALETRGQARAVKGLDLSATGLSFRLGPGPAPEAAPREGDTIKIQFTTPGGEAIACLALVVRVSIVDEWHPELGDRRWTKVAVRFHKLPAAHERALRLALGPLSSPDGPGLVPPAGQAKSAARALRLAGATAAAAASLAALAAPYGDWWSALAWAIGLVSK